MHVTAHEIDLTILPSWCEAGGGDGKLGMFLVDVYLDKIGQPML